MEIYELRSLIKNKIKKMRVSEEWEMCLQEYKKLLEENNLPVNEINLFYAGYVIANPIVKEMLLRKRKQEIKRQKEICREIERSYCKSNGY